MVTRREYSKPFYYTFQKIPFGHIRAIAKRHFMLFSKHHNPKQFLKDWKYTEEIEFFGENETFYYFKKIKEHEKDQEGTAHSARRRVRAFRRK
jgi:hypothetical protein